MKVFVSVLFNLEDSEVIGIYKSLDISVKKTFDFLVKNEYLDYYEGNEEENEEKSISKEDFLKLLQKESDNWNYEKIDEICQKYNSGYDRKHMFIKIEEIEIFQ